MVRIQLLTGCRPGEICILRPADVDRSDEVWLYRPPSHKTEHHGRSRHILLGPRAQEILRRYLDRPAERYCFSPSDSENGRLATRRANRQSPMTPSQASRRAKPNRIRGPGDCYTNDSYRRAIARACMAAFPAPADIEPSARKERIASHTWSPNQLRHAAATRLANHYESLLVAKETLGHSSIRVTEGYAKPSLDLARRAMWELG